MTMEPSIVLIDFTDRKVIGGKTYIRCEVEDQGSRKKRRSPQRWKAWTEDDDTRLLSMWEDGHRARTIARTLGRTSPSIISRLKALRDHGKVIEMHSNNPHGSRGKAGVR
jgi:hypothetical protein